MSLLACATLVAVAIIPKVASAQQAPCSSYGTLLGAFAKKYGEAPTGRGLVGLGESKRMVELWTSPEGSWTMVVVTPTGMTCVRASGEGWIEIPYEPFIPSSLPISHDPDAQFQWTYGIRVHFRGEDWGGLGVRPQ